MMAARNTLEHLTRLCDEHLADPPAPAVLAWLVRVDDLLHAGKPVRINDNGTIHAYTLATVAGVVWLVNADDPDGYRQRVHAERGCHAAIVIGHRHRVVDYDTVEALAALPGVLPWPEALLEPLTRWRDPLVRQAARVLLGWRGGDRAMSNAEAEAVVRRAWQGVAK